MEELKNALTEKQLEYEILQGKAKGLQQEINKLKADIIIGEIMKGMAMVGNMVIFNHKMKGISLEKNVYGYDLVYKNINNRYKRIKAINLYSLWEEIYNNINNNIEYNIVWVTEM